MSGVFRATPFARLFCDIFWKGVVRRSTIWALLIFFALQNFSRKTNHLCIPKWIAYLKTNTKGIKRKKKRGKKVGVLYCGGGFIIVNRELAYFIAGGFINAMWTLHTELLHTDAFTHRSLFTELTDRRYPKVWRREAFTQSSFYTQTLLHRDAESSFCTQTPQALTHRSFYT